MLYSIKEKIRKSWFNISCRDILSIEPIEPKESELVIVSMVSHVDLMMYLVAIRSFYHHLGEGKIIILNDGSLTTHDRDLLEHHLSPRKIIDAREMNSEKCPHYISWKRLLFISDAVHDNYVIQVDADTLTLHNIPEAVSCIKDNRSFILGTWREQKIQTMREICERVKSNNSNHVQVMAEKNLDRLADYEHLNYVRGCAAFTGFAKGSFSRSEVEHFSLQMKAIVGSKWLNWGSEQTTTNYIIANSPHALVLPYPKYAGFKVDRDLSGSSFLHFSGTHRFKRRIYLKTARKLIDSLQASSLQLNCRT
jgi:hypothetical protein